MKVLAFLSGLLILATTAFFLIPSEKPILPEIPENGRVNEKHEPSEEFFLQRAYPNATFDYIAYEKALRQAKANAALKDDMTFPGFDNEWRVEGPGNIGARINTVVVHPSDENIIYAGFSDGGVFKTTDGGNNWTPIFDDQVFLVTGDIALDPINPDIVYIGTGDPNISGYPSIGDGLYKSVDGGATWTHLGLTDQRIISKVVPHPTDQNTLYVSTMGLPFERNNDRGLYKTVDGGDNWEQVLYLNDSTGVIDVLINPQAPDTLYAATWNRIRNNNESIARGIDSKIFKSVDGGENWTQLTSGLPSGVHSRVGLAMSATNPEKVYALYVGNDNNYDVFGVYRTDDGGENWVSLGVADLQTFNALGGFGWYFGKIRVNPVNDNEVYILGVDMFRTVNEGQTWEMATPIWWEYTVHADKHDLVFTSSGSMVLATDGGLYRSPDGGDTWNDIENIPTTQFYRVAWSPHTPDQYYGGAQDNGTTGGNSLLPEWPRIYGGDGFQPLFHPTDPNIMYVETQRGNINMTIDGGISGWFSITSGFAPGEQRHWDMQYIMSADNSNLLYTGAEKVYRNDFPEAGIWTEISPDLVGEGGFRSSISTVAESPINTNFLYAGTSNGRAWRTLDLGLNWDEVTSGLPDRYVSSIKASPETADVVYVTHSGYRDNDFFPHVHRSDDNGDNWIPIANDLPPLSVNDIIVLPNHADSILFVATDGGIYGSMNSGQQWERVGDNMPIIPVFDLTHDETNNRLVAGTFARGIQTFPIDSILVEVVDPPVSVNQIFDESAVLNLFPVPASSHINLDFFVPAHAKAVNLVMFDAVGRVLWNETVVGTGAKVLKKDISDLVQGVYFVNIESGGEKLSGAFNVVK
ncbi:MAG: T9SS type A sorting domain-containing protein [Bacteroidota bacterium]